MFLPEFAVSTQGSFMEDPTEDQFLTYRSDDQVSGHFLLLLHRRKWNCSPSGVSLT